MNKAAVIGVVLVLAAISFAVGFFVGRQPHADGKGEDSSQVDRLKAELKAVLAQSDDFAKENNPKLWLDQGAASMVEKLGYDHIWLVRWRNGALDGWVEFDEADGPKRLPLDHSRRHFDSLAKEGRQPVAKGSHGNILFALRQIGKSDEFNCELVGSYSVATADGGGIGSTYRNRAKVKLENFEDKWGIRRFGLVRSDLGVFATPFPAVASVERYVNNTAVPWLSVKLVEVSK